MTDSTSRPATRGPWLPLFIVAAALLVVAAIVLTLVLTVFRPSAAPAPTPTPTPTSTASRTPTPTPSPTTTGGVALCTTRNTTVSLGQPSGAAGSTYLPVVFTNSGSVPCALNGYPTVEFVGDGNGTTIGPPAGHDTTVAPTLTTIAPGKAAGTTVRITDADDACGGSTVAVDGFRVIPPGSDDAFFVATTAYPACAAQALLTVTAIAGP